MKLVDNFLILLDPSDLKELKTYSISRYLYTNHTYAFYDNSFIRIDDSSFPQYYIRSQDTHIWNRVNADHFRDTLTKEMDILTNKKRQLTDLAAQSYRLIHPYEDVTSP